MPSLREEIAALKSPYAYPGLVNRDEILAIIDKHEAKPREARPGEIDAYMAQAHAEALERESHTKPEALEETPCAECGIGWSKHCEMARDHYFASSPKPEASYVTGVTGGTLVKKSIFKQQCEAARGSEGWQEAERELAEHKAREERPARDELHRAGPGWGHALEALAIVEAIDAQTKTQAGMAIEVLAALQAQRLAIDALGERLGK